MESSTSTMLLPSTSARIGIVLELHAEVPNFLARLDKGPSDIVGPDDPSSNGMPDSWLYPIAAGTPLSGTGTT